jgi:hypothetical protein
MERQVKAAGGSGQNKPFVGPLRAAEMDEERVRAAKAAGAEFRPPSVETSCIA